MRVLHRPSPPGGTASSFFFRPSLSRQLASRNGRHSLDSLDSHPDELELRMSLRHDLHDMYLFRRAVRTLTRYDMSPTEPITYTMMAAWTKKIGKIIGLGIGTIPNNLRYNAGNEFDQSGSVSDALRTLILGHANSYPFQKHYLGREIYADL
ncbi:hypothetical protein NKR23_g10461 [Pleurostoma richardsiae]|uniref:Uncharacterized protein n=1 Tax=Pleurostoma richardsiae TaxID=41990 RepID=A0AA38R547_9PEZI|nr:hypothetical protein NKR23_g10461 [Pleurostoma richardsiae]